jgi:Flp pilus assembly protein TadG
MLPSTRPIPRALARLISETRGAEIAEAAAVLPLMFMMLLGIFWFGQAFSIYGAITRAAQEGARAGSFPTYATCTTGCLPNTLSQYAINAVSATNNVLVSSNLNPTSAIWGPTPLLNYCVSSLGSGTGTASCTSVSTHICVLSPVQTATLASAAGGSGVCGTVVTFQYPFQFWLPFTSLNKQQIWLTAQARARMETH